MHAWKNPMTYEYRYSVDRYPETRSEAYVYRPPKYKYSSNRQYDLNDEYDLEAIVEECADDYWSNHDGWECRSWSDGGTLTFSVWVDEERCVDFDVSVEFAPEFRAYRSKE